MNPLESHRKELLETTKNILNQMSIRKTLVGKIQKTKVDMNEKAWSPEQEHRVFNSLHLELKEMSLKELFAVSIMIEAQAVNSHDYPRWSEGEHLNFNLKNFTEQINPILLYLYHPREYAKLELRAEFSSTLEEVIKSDS